MKIATSGPVGMYLLLKRQEDEQN